MEFLFARVPADWIEKVMVLMLMVRRLIAVRWSWCFSVARYWVDLKSPESISLIAGHVVLPGAYVFSRDAARSNPADLRS